jgi:phosphoribosylformylglycinamidine (FGAM) synthase-like amidotransferase family enzyme/selenophosphate synthetase-related protein
MLMSVGIIRYPGSNCDIETLQYFNNYKFNHNLYSFYIWHTCEDVNILNNVKLLVIPGGFAFGDRVYDKATNEYTISPGTKALSSPVSVIINKAKELNIPILGICNGFQILTQMGLLPGKLVMNDCQSFICDKVNCIVEYDNNKTNVNLCIANSYGKYINEDKLLDEESYFIKYENGDIAGVCNKNTKIFGMMPHPERNNIDFKHLLFKILLGDSSINSHLQFDKCINELMFSEHISYKTTRRYLKNLHTKEDWVIQGPGENAGIVYIGDSDDGTEYCIAIRIESHNHPTYINPFEGAATGVGGILRDIFTMGARPIGIMDFLRFGTDDNSKELLEKSIQGISYYGNCVGVPNIGGELKLHESYNKNPLVNVGCLGIVKKDNIIYGNAMDTERCLVYVGSKTGNEGINGAAMASDIFDENINMEEMKKNVQKSDPFLEKLLLEACLEISELKLVEGMQDMGAGGLLCASLEVIKRGREKTNLNLGVKINLDSVPTKYDMEPSNILISESQERMLIVCKQENVKKIESIFEKWDLEYSVIGTTNNTGNYSVYYGDDNLYNRPMDSFSDIHDYSCIPICENNNIISEPIKVKENELWKVYDSTVGGRTIKGSDKPGSFAILDIYEIKKQLILTWGETFDECHNLMKDFEGVKPLCIVDCLNYGHPKECMSRFKYMLKELNEKCTNYNIPIVGGNVSLYNCTGDDSIRDTPILIMMGISN